ncbi:aspartate ammonia-lyase [Maridesulfovibrio ferrireducens]|uniref:Aspartate ammonia-lyase n=1 Tax=Maridesulfovibrio ferrireducens TaxID=246191 RepID=A0A1G9J5C4_9BACT|nr:aspartate ammonia-lyase [Maridesulfovibrio ferrireducens]SDL32354.1 aspartate ammonia-lyase [Maridesulfovibrio ferrireducens]
MNSRTEHDCIGSMEVPEEALYGVQTQRAAENFKITGIPISHYPHIVNALAYIKKAAAITNNELGKMDDDKTKAIVFACDELLNGKYHDQFIVDVIQGGAGTSTNMNANEVISNVGLEFLGYKRGEYDNLHPNIHVNMAQSTNDVYPTCLRIALLGKMELLMEAMEYLRKSFAAKGKEFSHVLKMGRTQLQDAVPMTLGQEFNSYAIMIGEDIERVREAMSLICEINMGGTAIGTGLNAPPKYAQKVTDKLKDLTGFELTLAPDLIEATQDTGAYVQLSGVLKRVAVKISKICNDLRLLSSGPRCGLNEINLPRMAPGSSIMPGKVNPIIPEVINQIAFTVIGGDITVTMAAEAGQLELNVMEPVITASLLNSLTIMRRGFKTLADRCVSGITANEDVCRGYVENSIGLVTALNPYIGYEKSTEVASEALKTKRSVYDIVIEKGYMSKEELDKALSPESMIHTHPLTLVPSCS